MLPRNNISGGFNSYDPHRHTCLNAWPQGSGTIRCYCLIGVSIYGNVGGCVSLCMQVLTLYILKLCPVCDTVYFLLAADQDVELSNPSPEPCVPVSHYAPLHDKTLKL